MEKYLWNNKLAGITCKKIVSCLKLEWMDQTMHLKTMMSALSDIAYFNSLNY